MAPLTPAFLLCLCLAPLSALAQNKEWELVLLPTEGGACAIDGTQAAYYIKWGVGADVNKIILFWEGGGWCTSPESCWQRSSTSLGTSRGLPASRTDYSVRDLLMPNCSVNPAFCNWTTVYAPYLDGQSRSGNLAEPLPYVVNSSYTAMLCLGGYRNLVATVKQLIGDPFPGHAPVTSFANATHVLISGSSAGGLTTQLHADFVADAVHAVNPAAIVKAIPEVGFFIDGASVWGGQHIMTEAYFRAVEMANITGGSVDQLNKRCIEHYRATDPGAVASCFLAQVNYAFVQTPMFIVNSKEDQWQLQNVLAPNPDFADDVSPWAPWLPCISAPSTNCNATQYAQFQNYSVQFMAALNASRAAMPAAYAANCGGIITSCDLHTTLIGGFSHKIAVDGMTLYEALVAWFFQTKGPGSEQYWTIDGPWPTNPTCEGPHVEEAERMGIY